MGIKSKSQLKRLEGLVKLGMMTQEALDKEIKDTPNFHTLPERSTVKGPKKIKKAKVI